MVKIYDSETIDQFQWPDTQEGKMGRDYLIPLIKEEVPSYLPNVKTKVYLVANKDLFFPFTLNEKEYENSYVASNYYALKFYEEKISKTSPFLLKLQKPLLMMMSSVLKLCKVNKTIFLNNWLMTNSLAQNVSTKDLKPILAALIEKFPKHLIVFRHVDTKMKKDLLSALKENRFALMKTREIYIYNPEDKLTQNKKLRHVSRRDLKILEKYNFEVVHSEGIVESDFSRLLQLYEMVYHNKYSKYSPKYSEKFLKMIHEKKCVHTVALKREGVIEGFFTYFIFSKTLCSCLSGFDTSLPHSHDIYKLLTRLVIEEAEKHNVYINDGSGSEGHKSNRGLKPFPEYMGLYSSHLPFSRRILWKTVSFFYGLFSSRS